MLIDASYAILMMRASYDYVIDATKIDDEGCC